MLTLPLRIKIISVIIMFILFFSFGYFLIIQSKISLLAQLKSRQTILALSLQQQRAKLNQYKKEQLTINNSVKKQQPIIQSLSKPLNLTEFLAVLIELSQKNHVSMQALSPQPSIVKDQFSLQPIHVIISGDYYSLKNWLIDLFNTTQTIVINQLTMSFKKENSLTMDIEIVIYKILLNRYQK